MKHLHLAATLDPAPDEWFDLGRWRASAAAAEADQLDLVTIQDAFGAGRPDAAMIACWLAPQSEHLGLVPVVTTTHTEPFHVSTAIATLDHVSGGRGGWLVRVSPAESEAELVGRRPAPAAAELFAEAADAVEVVRRLWDSWEDDAVIADVPTGRYVDRDRLHHVDFSGPYFSVRGPSIVPRPPQGQPVVFALVDRGAAFAFATASADVVIVADVADVPAVRRRNPALRILADVTVVAGEDPGRLADRLVDRAAATGVDGFRLCGAWPVLTPALVPALRERGARPAGPPAGTLRDRLHLPRAVNRYAAR